MHRRISLVVDTCIRKSGETSWTRRVLVDARSDQCAVYTCLYLASRSKRKRTRIWNLSRLSGSVLLRTHTYLLPLPKIDHSFCLVISVSLFVSFLSLITPILELIMETPCTFHFVILPHL